MEAMTPPLIVALTGSSGAILGVRALEILRECGVPVHLVISRAAARTLAFETGRALDEVAGLAERAYDPEDISAPVASGSFPARGMLIAPCSIKTLSAVANSYAADLIARSADVTLKEGRPLLLAVRETPLHRGHLRLMDLAARSGAILFPPVPAFYAHPTSLDEMVNHLAGRMLARLGIPNPYAPVWRGLNETI